MMKYMTLFSLLLLLSSACNRSTMVSGRITNLTTGNPVVGMKVELSIYNGNEPKDSANPKKVGAAVSTTGPNGEYALEISGSGIDGASLSLRDGVLCSAFFDAKYSDQVAANAAREVNIQVDSIDGTLQLVLDNQSGLSDRVYVRVDCDQIAPKGYACCNHDFENLLSAGQSNTLNFGVSAGRYVSVYWGESTFPNWDAPHIDSVFCPRGQVTQWKLSF